MSQQKNIDTSVVVHADRLELLLPASLANCDLLSAQFHDLITHWKTTYGLASRAKKCLSGVGKLVFWELELWNNDIRITLTDCPALHIQDTGKALRQEPDWLFNPFPTREQLYEHYSSIDLNYLGVLRITCKDKTDPHKYTWYLWKLLSDLEKWGVEHKSRLLEIAIDVYDHALADRLQRTVRLAGHKSPLDLGHWNNGMQDGASCNGHNEYEHCRKFLRDRTRQLHLYERWDSGFFRIELRLGQVYLHRYCGSQAFHTDLLNSGGRCRANPQSYLESDRPQPKFHSPTLALLDTAPALIRRHLMFESLDVEKLLKEHPRLSTLGLDRLSIRGQRYYLTRAKIPIRDYARRVAVPDFQSITPADLEARELNAGLNKCAIEKNEEDDPLDACTTQGVILSYPAPSIKPTLASHSGRCPRSRSP